MPSQSFLMEKGFLQARDLRVQLFGECVSQLKHLRRGFDGEEDNFVPPVEAVKAVHPNLERLHARDCYLNHLLKRLKMLRLEGRDERDMRPDGLPGDAHMAEAILEFSDQRCRVSPDPLSRPPGEVVKGHALKPGAISFTYSPFFGAAWLTKPFLRLPSMAKGSSCGSI